MQPPPPEVNPYAPPAADVGALDFAQYALDDAVLAERGTRFFAHLVDQLLYLLAAIPGFIGFFATNEATDPDTVELLVYAWIVPLLLLLAAYQWYLVATTGQSLAKRWFGIRIVRMSGAPVGFLHGVVLRSWVLGAMNSACSLVSLVDALAIFGQQCRCIHDHIADTKVVRA